ncbi:hypothetical protein BDY24DRAFT_397048 [Mrakia frigida]|uniref:uncharacterized protein n=1 Tax=Mrakia frigida TaxID=29902 RepID=UPI003FCBFA2F
MSSTLLGVATLALVSSTTWIVPASAATYNLVEEHSGATFFNGWTFADAPDITTSGDVQYVNSSSNPSLAYVNDAGNAIIKVSTEEVIWNNKRNSVRLDLDTAYDVGTVWVFDAIHLPYSCSTWPAFWTKNDLWPVGGEIDILEGINLAESNQMALHTIAGCTPANDATMISGGTIGDQNCNNTIGAGCTVKQTATNSYGTEFNSAGGGVWVTELATTGISIWFYSRADIPSAVTKSATSLDTSILGTPVAFWPSTGCSPISDYISKQRAVIDITLCGVWAGTNASLIENGCAQPVWPNDSCYTTYVLNSTNYVDAYFEISYMSIFSSNADVQSVSNVPVASQTGSSSASKTSGSASTSSTGTAAVGSTGGAFVRIGGAGGAWAGALVVGAVVGGLVFPL